MDLTELDEHSSKYYAMKRELLEDRRINRILNNSTSENEQFRKRKVASLFNYLFIQIFRKQYTDQLT